MTIQTTTVNSSIIGGETHTADDDGTITHSISHNSSTEYTSGNAADKAEKIWSDKNRSLAATSEELDLAGGLTDEFGAAITFTKIKSIRIYNRQTEVGYDLKVGGAAANAFLLFDNATDIKTVGPGGTLFSDEPSLAGMPVTAGTGDLLKIDAGANTVAYDIVIVGTTT